MEQGGCTRSKSTDRPWFPFQEPLRSEPGQLKILFEMYSYICEGNYCKPFGVTVDSAARNYTFAYILWPDPFWHMERDWWRDCKFRLACAVKCNVQNVRPSWVIAGEQMLTHAVLIINFPLKFGYSSMLPNEVTHSASFYQALLLLLLCDYNRNYFYAGQLKRQSFIVNKGQSTSIMSLSPLRLSHHHHVCGYYYGGILCANWTANLE